MMEIINDFIIKCSKCGKKILVERDSLELDSNSYERNMGFEIEYIFSGVSYCECGNEVTYKIYGWEYPEGAFNYRKAEIFDGEFLIKPNVEVIYYDFECELGINQLGNVEFLKEEIRNMTSREFEKFVCDYFNRQGFEAKVTPKTRDGGFDIICKKNKPTKLIIYVECKHYTKDNKVSVNVVRGLYGVHVSEKVNQSILVTSSTFTRDARKFVSDKKNLIELVDIDGLINWLLEE